MLAAEEKASRLARTAASGTATTRMRRVRLGAVSVVPSRHGVKAPRRRSRMSSNPRPPRAMTTHATIWVYGARSAWTRPASAAKNS